MNTHPRSRRPPGHPRSRPDCVFIQSAVHCRGRLADGIRWRGHGDGLGRPCGIRNRLHDHRGEPRRHAGVERLDGLGRCDADRTGPAVPRRRRNAGKRGERAADSADDVRIRGQARRPLGPGAGSLWQHRARMRFRQGVVRASRHRGCAASLHQPCARGCVQSQRPPGHRRFDRRAIRRREGRDGRQRRGDLLRAAARPARRATAHDRSLVGSGGEPGTRLPGPTTARGSVSPGRPRSITRWTWTFAPAQSTRCSRACCSSRDPRNSTSACRSSSR